MSGNITEVNQRSASENSESPDTTERDNGPTATSNFHYFPSITTWFQNLNKPFAATVLILCYVNLINYMDRSTVAGVMNDIENDPYFNVKSNFKDLGLLQTAFVICYMLCAPVFGYLGDRYNRKWILILGLTLWALSTFFGSFMKNFWAFLAFRALVGIGEASYSTIAPAIISDLFRKDSRSKVLALFYFAIPVGTGLGYILGSEVAANTSDWRWGLRVTPFMGLFAILLIVFLMIDPERGHADGAHLNPSSPREDLKALMNNKSFCLSVIGFTCVTFTAGSLMWWGPDFAYLGAKAACGRKAGCENITQAEISYKFGIVMALAGLLGVPLGSYISQIIRHKVPNGDPLVCGTTLVMSVPVLFFGFFAARYSLNWCIGLTFLAGLLLNCNWAIVSDITLYIVIPTRRSIASATQILVSHALGDAISPYLIGVVADWIRPSLDPLPPNPDGEPTPHEFDIKFRCLQYALFGCCFFQLAGAFCFLVMSWYVLDDKREADRVIAETNAMLEDENEAITDDQAPIVSHEVIAEQS